MPLINVGAFKSRNFNVFTAGQSVSTLGTWMFNVTVMWILLEQGSSSLTVGIVIAAAVIPVVVFAPLGGSVADRVPLRSMLIVANVLSGVVVAAFAMLSVGGLPGPVACGLAVFALGVATAFEAPGRQAFLFELVGEDGLENAVVVTGLTYDICRVLGPVAAGPFLAAGLPLPGLAVNAVSFFVTVATLLAVRNDALVSRPVNDASGGGMGEAIRVVRAIPGVSLVCVTFAFVGLFAMTDLVTIPVLAQEVDADVGRSVPLLLTSFAAGAFIGGLLLLLIHRFRYRTVYLMLAGLATAAAALALVPRTLSALAPVFVLGLFVNLYQVSVQAYLSRSVPTAVRGRAMAIYYLLNFGSYGIGGPLIGWVCGIGTSRLAFGIAFAVAGGCALLLLLLRPSEQDGSAIGASDVEPVATEVQA